MHHTVFHIKEVTKFNVPFNCLLSTRCAWFEPLQLSTSDSQCCQLWQQLSMSTMFKAADKLNTIPPTTLPLNLAEIQATWATCRTSLVRNQAVLLGGRWYWIDGGQDYLDNYLQDFGECGELADGDVGGGKAPAFAASLVHGPDLNPVTTILVAKFLWITHAMGEWSTVIPFFSTDIGIPSTTEASMWLPINPMGRR